jgi:hypothetical protein
MNFTLIKFSVSSDSIVDKLILTEFVDWLNQLQSEGISVWKKYGKDKYNLFGKPGAGNTSKFSKRKL